MGSKLGGFVCNGCTVFQQYRRGRNSLDTDHVVEYLIPDNWEVISDHKVSDKWVKSDDKELVIYCGNCSRSLKINKIRHEILKKETDF